VGVIGTFVWDVIHGRDTAIAPMEEWGGITYALSAFDAALPSDWEFVPLVKVGSDLWSRAREYLSTMRRVARDALPIEVPQPNNRVVLRYVSAERRTEVLSGGVPPWTWLGLKPLLVDLDALYVNFTSGFEMDLETLQLVRQHFAGPIYCDLHSLLLSIQPSGLRTPKHLERPDAWCACADIVQVNEDEMALMAPDPLALSATAMGAGVKCLVVTLGSRGAVYVAAAGFDSLADVNRTARLNANTGPIRTELVAAERPPTSDTGDPTGCGDVFGATYFSRLLAGDNLGDALRAALRAGARNVSFRGASSLARYLRGEILEL
jgi:hypothetical protein